MCGIPFSAFIWDPIGYILKKVYKHNFNVLVFNLLIWIATILDRLIINTADEILVGGKAHNLYFEQLSKYVEITVIPPSVHPVHKMHNGKRSGILLLTAWKKGKHPEYVFEILEQIPHARITLVGKWLDVEYLSEFTSQVEKKGYKKNITIVGSVTESELSNYYSKAEVFLQVNDDRGFGMPALEAASNGTPFIIPEGQGVCELFTHRVHGFFVKEKDTKTIVKNIELLLSNESMARKMGNNCYSKVRNSYSWEVHAIELLKLIKRQL